MKLFSTFLDRGNIWYKLNKIFRFFDKGAVSDTSTRKAGIERKKLNGEYEYIECLKKV